MSDFTDFLAFTAIEEVMEEEEKKHPSYRGISNRGHYAETKRKPPTPGCFIIIGSFVLALAFTFIWESLWILIGGSILGLFVGLLYDTYQAAWGKKEKKDITDEVKEDDGNNL